MSMPLFVALVDAADTTFLPAYRRVDLDIFRMEIRHKEHDFPRLIAVMKNPRRGLLNGPRWCWLVYNYEGHEVPLYFGAIQGLPNDLNQETITANFIARSTRWMLLKQAVAETLKSQDGYDPVFINTASRDDPDSILEGFASAFHFDRVPSGSPADLAVSVSDMLEAEDGIEVFQKSDVFYDNFNLKIVQTPLVRAGAHADVHWTQQAAGTVDMGSYLFGNGQPIVGVTPGGYVTVNPGGGGYTTSVQNNPYTADMKTFGSGDPTICYTGGSLIDSWPKAGTSLGGGYTVAASFALNGGAQFGNPQQHTYRWENQDTEHTEGDTMSINQSWTTYPCGGYLFIYDVFQQPGLVDPWGSLTLQGPTGVNIPLHVTYSETLVCAWQVTAALVLNYHANRPHTETLEFQLDADVQPILTEPNAPASVDSDISRKSGADVGEPIINVKSWYTLFLYGGVQVGQVVKSTPEFAGAPIYSIAIAVTGSGNVGSTEPTWPTSLGSTVVDGDVTWASWGYTIPANFPSWKDVQNSDVALGTIIRAQTFFHAPVDYTGVPIPAPASGTQSFQLCTTAGHTEYYSNATFTGLSETRPAYPQPYFSPTAGDTTTDGTAVWTSLGDGGSVMEVPLGLNPAQDCYFPTDRGAKSIRYHVACERAKLRSRSRAVAAKFDTTFEKAMNLSCRMGATVYDDRLPGGVITGKIIEYALIIEAEGTAKWGEVTVGCAVGYGGSLSAGTLDADYGDEDWDDGYQIVYGPVITSYEGDVSYSQPVCVPDSDGVTFPIYDKSQILVKEALISGRPPGAPEYLPNSFITVNDVMTMPAGYGGYQYTYTRYVDVPTGYAPIQVPYDYTDQWTGIAYALQQVYFAQITQAYFELKSLEQSFAKQYDVQCSELILPLQIDTEAASLP